jgi:hypothetical protein
MLTSMHAGQRLMKISDLELIARRVVEMMAFALQAQPARALLDTCGR